MHIRPSQNQRTTQSNFDLKWRTVDNQRWKETFRPSWLYFALEYKQLWNSSQTTLDEPQRRDHWTRSNQLQEASIAAQSKQIKQKERHVITYAGIKQDIERSLRNKRSPKQARENDVVQTQRRSRLIQIRHHRKPRWRLHECDVLVDSWYFVVCFDISAVAPPRNSHRSTTNGLVSDEGQIQQNLCVARNKARDYSPYFNLQLGRKAPRREPAWKSEREVQRVVQDRFYLHQAQGAAWSTRLVLSDQFRHKTAVSSDLQFQTEQWLCDVRQSKLNSTQASSYQQTVGLEIWMEKTQKRKRRTTTTRTAAIDIGVMHCQETHKEKERAKHKDGREINDLFSWVL